MSTYLCTFGEIDDKTNAIEVEAILPRKAAEVFCARMEMPMTPHHIFNVSVWDSDKPQIHKVFAVELIVTRKLKAKELT